MELKAVIEAILFAAQGPLSLKEIKTLLSKADDGEDVEQTEIVRAFKKTKEAEIVAVIEELQKKYQESGCSFQVQQVANSYQLISLPQFAPWLKQMLGEHQTGRLSQPALETLAIIAYRQPITRADIESVRGVAVDGVMQTLLERGLVSIVGRAEIPGRPMLYGTTKTFLEKFGMNSLNELPACEELRRMEIPALSKKEATATPDGAEAPVPAENNPPTPEADAEQAAKATEAN
jgi:segregation and condensation protein B